MIVLPTATLEVNERPVFSSGAADQAFAAGSNVATLVRPSKVARLVPPIEYSWPWTSAEPATFLASGMSARDCHMSAAML
jgi:hypothetical protein